MTVFPQLSHPSVATPVLGERLRPISIQGSVHSNMSDNRDRLNEFLLQQIEELKAENAGLRKDLRMLEQAQRIRELEEMVQAKGGGREAKRPRGGDEKDEAVVQGEKRMKGDAERPSFDKRESGVATAGNNSNGQSPNPSA